MGLICVALGGPWRADFLAPGELTHAHGQILSDQNRCAACHAGGNLPVSAWVWNTLSAGNHIRQPQWELCIKCHGDTIPFDHAVNPHTVSHESLAQTTDALMAAWQLAESSAVADQSIGCSHCHREHHGPDHPLVKVGNSQCQSCHLRSIGHFALDHPEFRHWPTPRQPRIDFDHATHEAKYFAQAGRQYECRDCHRETANAGPIVASVGYERACASCHDDDIRASLSGMAWLTIPVIDTKLLRRARIDIGSWPAAADGDFDGALPHLMQILLAADPLSRQALAQLPDTADLADVNPEDRRQLQAVGQLAWGIKRLLAELATDGQDAVQRRLGAIQKGPLSPAETRALCQGLPSIVFADAGKLWFPQLDRELRDRAPRDPRAALNQTNNEHMYSNMVVRQRVPEFERVTGVIDGPIQLAAHVTDGGGVAGGSDDLLIDGPMDPSTVDRRVTEGNGEAVAGRVSDAHPEGWYRQDGSMSVGYLPAGHADPMIAAWLEWLALHRGVEKAGVASMWKSWTEENPIGRCAVCHEVKGGEPALGIEWRAVSAAARADRSTKFEHGPHLIQPQLRDCRHCHRLAEQVTGESADGESASQTTHGELGDFRPLERANCAGCHTRDGAGDHCIQCHQYHRGG